MLSHKRDATFQTARFVNTAAGPHSQILIHTSPYIIPHDTSLLIKVPPRPPTPPPSPPQSLTSLLFPPPPCFGKEKSMCLDNIAPVYNVYPRLLPCNVSACGWKIRVDAPFCSSCVNGTGLPLNYRRVDCRVSACCDVKPRLHVTVVWRKFHPPDVDWMITLRWIFSKWDVGVWTGLTWLRIETRDGHLWVR